MKIVVTGASGYIGRALVSRLAHTDNTCVALSRTDVTDAFRCMLTGRVAGLEEHMDAADAVVHLAGRLVDNPRATIADYFQPNVAFTDNVMAAAVAQSVKTVVHASSRLVYPRTLREPAVEDRDASPDTPYGMSKAWAEDVVRVRTHGTDTSAISLRIGQVTGGGHPGVGVINAFVRQAIDGGEVRVNGEGAAVRDVLHVNDVVEALIGAGGYSGSWLPVNVGGSAPWTIADIATEVARCAGLEPSSVTHVPVAHEDLSCYALDSERARAVLDWAPRHSMADIIAEAWTTQKRMTHEDR